MSKHPPKIKSCSRNAKYYLEALQVLGDLEGCEAEVDLVSLRLRVVGAWVRSSLREGLAWWPSG